MNNIGNVMSKYYLLLGCSFLISTAVVATEHEVKMDNSDHCANAAMDNSEKILFTSQPEEAFLEIVRPATSMTDRPGRLRIELIHFKALMNWLEDKIRKGERMPYKEHGIIFLHKGSFGSSLFRKLLHLYWSVLFYHNRKNSNATSYIVDMYQRRMMFLLSDKDKGVDVNYQDENGVNLLMMAAANGYDDIVEVLIQRGANLSQRTIGGRFQNQTVLTITRRALNWHEDYPPDATDRFNPRNVMDEELYWYEGYPPSEVDRDPEHIRVKKIEKYNRIIKLLKEAGATT